MALAKDLRQAIIQEAIQGKLTKQLKTDSNVDNLLEEIKKEKDKFMIANERKKEPELALYDKDDIPFKIPANWRWCQLGELMSYQNGYAYKSSDMVKGGKGYPVIKSQNLMTLKVVIKEENDYVEFPNRKMLSCQIRKNDLLMCLSSQSNNPEPLGKTAIYELDEPALLNQRVLKITLMKTDMLQYIFYVINSSYFHYNVSHKGDGSAQSNLKLEHVREMLIPLPPIEEQQRIVEKINKIMSKIDEYEKIEKELEVLKKIFPTDMKDALLQAAMQGKLTEQLESDSSVDEFVRNEKINILNENDYPYDIPDNWRFIKLEDLTTIPIKRGKSPKYVDKSGILVFAQKCNPKNGNISLHNAKYLDENIKNKYTVDNYLKRNDIVINSTGGGTLGRIGYISEELINNSLPIVPDSHITIVRIKEDILPKYIYFFLKFNQSYLETMGVGSTNQTELRPDTIKELLVPFPPIEEQQRIVERLEVLLLLCEDLKE